MPLAHPINVIYDFIPATGQVVTGHSGRDIASTAKCDACHGQLGGLPNDSVTAGTPVGSVPPSYLSLVSSRASSNLNASTATNGFAGVSNNSTAAFHEGAKNDVRYLVDINSASKAQLKKLPGIDDGTAGRIIAGRPYLSKAFFGDEQDHFAEPVRSDQGTCDRDAKCGHRGEAQGIGARKALKKRSR